MYWASIFHLSTLSALIDYGVLITPKWRFCQFIGWRSSGSAWLTPPLICVPRHQFCRQSWTSMDRFVDNGGNIAEFQLQKMILCCRQSNCERQKKDGLTEEKYFSQCSTDHIDKVFRVECNFIEIAEEDVDHAMEEHPRDLFNSCYHQSLEQCFLCAT